MAKQTFTAGQVLTAAEMNSLQENDYNWTVTTKTASYTLAAGDEGTRVVMNSGSATTITVDDAVFAAGDVVWIHNIGAGTCTVTAGTATVNTDGSLALTQYQGGQLFFTSASSAIFFPNVGAQAGGKILQIVRATDGTDRTTSTATFADANISVTITPTDSSSTLLIVWTNLLISDLSTQLSAHLQITDSSNTALSGAEAARIGNGGGSSGSYHYNTLIGYAAPATTSAVTYKGRWKLHTATYSATLANATTTAQMFALEVGA